MIDRLAFGRTGHESTRVIFGSAGLGFVDQDRADSVLPILLEHGVNHIDTAAAYGEAEVRLAPWLAGHPNRFFVATKTGERSGEDARRSLEHSLQRLGVDHVDLIQLHNLVEEEEWEVAHSPRGALAALAGARDEGLVSYIGITGHGLRIAKMHLRCLERFDYDSVLLPYNFLLLCEDDYRRDVEILLELCEERAVAVQTIKSIARRRWPRPDEPDGDPGSRGEVLSWYEPLADDRSIGHAVQYVLGREGLFLITSSDFRRLPAVMAAAEKVNGIPRDDVMAADTEELSMTPLFDGRDLERI